MFSLYYILVLAVKSPYEILYHWEIFDKIIEKVYNVNENVNIKFGKVS